MRQIGVGSYKTSRKARKYVNEVLDSNRLSYGPFHRRFESLFALEHDCKHAIFLNSGTSALQVALQALKEIHGWKDGDEVIVPATTFIATSNIVLHNKMIPIFVDVDSATFNIDATLIERAITPRTRAIIPVHLLGLPCDMDPISDIAIRNNLKIIEDSCETSYATYRGRKVGSLGDIGCFSTYVAHYIVTGAGGLCTTSNPDLAVKIRSLINHGRDSIYLSIDDNDPTRMKEVIAKRFSFTSVGHSFRSTEMEAALGLAQLEEKNSVIKRRLQVAARLYDGLKLFGNRLQLPSCPRNRVHVYMLFGLVLKGEDKTDLVNHLEANGVETRDLMPLVTQPVYRSILGTIRESFPTASMLARSGFYIGCHQEILDEEVDYVIAKFSDYFKAH